MIRLLGTSHVSPESIEAIQREIGGDVDCVAVELDPSRYHSLKHGKRTKPNKLFFRLLSWIQMKIGRRTGVMPGEEMLKAVESATSAGKDVYLIDQSIEETMWDIDSVGFLEKLKLLFSSLTFFGPANFDLREVPSYELVEDVLEHLKRYSPEIYRVLVEKRDRFMARELEVLDSRYGTVLAVVGMGHLPGIRKILEEGETEYEGKTF